MHTYSATVRDDIAHLIYKSNHTGTHLDVPNATTLASDLVAIMTDPHMTDVHRDAYAVIIEDAGVKVRENARQHVFAIPWRHIASVVCDLRV